ncbi:Laccase [Quillaja saponaria]|uniref:Laccase n=1 Tax=Quillaja saponaria TaxID=32244 RepID=A0AAD7M6R1_QUISA|nr:Laccase [Quillaja saponaria]
MNEEQFFGIAQHNLTVVGSDAAYIKPISTTDYIMITPGQTMDVLVTANQSPDFYYIASTPFVDGQAEFSNSTNTAILQYNGNYNPSSPIPFPSLPSYNDSTAAENFRKLLRSLASKDHPINVPLNVTRSIYMTISVNQIYCENASCSGPDGNKLAASLNNISFTTLSIDILQAYFKYFLFPHFSLIFSLQSKFYDTQLAIGGVVWRLSSFHLMFNS